MSINRLVLVLNATYEPLNVCPARRAITLVMKGAAVVEERSAYTIRTAKINIPVPSVVRLLKYRRMPRLNRSVSRKGIILRDSSTCQYCQRKMLPKDLTLDHVTPRSRGGETAWDNLVASCFRCNNRKGSRTPQEAGMALAKAPKQITIHSRHRLLAGDQTVWDKYLFC
jgi:5-methylcytosine-specific restriction endonuclease McrA